MVILDRSDTRAPLKVWACGDWHGGSTHHDSALFVKHYERAVAERWLMLHLGDALELVTPTSRVALRGALREQIASTEDQRKGFIACLQRLEGGILLPGNHELRIDMATGLDFIATVTDAVGEKFTPLSEPGFVEIRVGRQKYTVYLHHGEGPIVNVTTLFDRIQRDTEGLDAILTGHVHASTYDPAVVDTPTGTRIIHRLRCGHYLRQPLYAKHRPIARIGAPGSWLLTLDPNEHKITPEWLQ